MDLKSGYKCFSGLLIGLLFIFSTSILQSVISKDLSYLSVLTSNSKSQKLSVGIDGVYIFTHNKDQYADIFRKTRPGANFYLGFHIEDIMLEVGYFFSTRRSKNIDIPRGGVFLGVPVVVDTRFTGKLRFKNTHLDLNFFSKLNDNFKIITGVGIGFLRAGITFKTTDFNDNYVNYNGNIEGKTNIIPRIGIGFSINIGDRVMFRNMIYFEQHSKVRLKYSPSVSQDKPFKDAYIVLAGFVFRI